MEILTLFISPLYYAAIFLSVTPHSARHAMGKHIMDKTRNIAAVQWQLGHRQSAYAMQYARVTAAELGQVLEDR